MTNQKLCPYCESNDNDFIDVNQSKEYSGIEMSLNRQGMFRVRYYDDSSILFVSQDVVNMRYCPYCGKAFKR